MSTGTTYLPDLPDQADLGDVTRGSLVRSEVRRIAHRRFIRWLIVVGAVGYLAILVIASTQYARTTPELLEQARAQVQEYVDQNNAYREQCINEQVPVGGDPDQFCGPPATVENFGGAESYLPKRPFDVARELPSFSIGIGVMVACFCFLMGATWIGAEWSQKTLMALLFWEPRRLKVFLTKITVLVAGLALVAAAAQAVMVGAGFLFGATKGTTTVSDVFWGDLLAQQGRLVLFAVLLGLIGFGIANLIRNTAAALGVGFVYFIAEIILQNVRPAWQEWFLTINAGALVNEGGLRVYVYTGEPVFQSDGSVSDGREILISNWHGGLVLGGLAVLLLLVGGFLFKRRDLT